MISWLVLGRLNDSLTEYLTFELMLIEYMTVLIISWLIMWQFEWLADWMLSWPTITPFERFYNRNSSHACGKGTLTGLQQLPRYVADIHWIHSMMSVTKQQVAVMCKCNVSLIKVPQVFIFPFLSVSLFLPAFRNSYASFAWSAQNCPESQVSKIKF
jgi:hypothetical protein